MCALRFLDSFDHYADAQLLNKWTVSLNASIVAVPRTGVNSLYINAGTAYTRLTLDAQGTWIIGVAFRPNAIAERGICCTVDGGTTQAQLRLNADGTLSLMRGGVVVATSIFAIGAAVWRYIEFKHIIDNVAGLLEARVDGAVWATFAGDTQNTANATANIIGLGRAPGNGYAADQLRYDDLYVLDGVNQSIADPNSPPNNDYLGDTQVQALVPDGAGAYTELATLVGAPTHWQAEDEVPPDEDVSYVEDSVVDRRDTFAMTNLAVVSATIPGIQILTRARKTAAGVANFARLYRNAAADNQGADTVLQTSYAYHLEILGGDPIAAGNWTVPNVNSLEMGFRVR